MENEFVGKEQDLFETRSNQRSKLHRISTMLLSMRQFVLSNDLDCDNSDVRYSNFDDKYRRLPLDREKNASKTINNSRKIH